MGTIQEKLNLTLNNKNSIKNAIRSKGIEVSDEEPFSSYAQKIIDYNGIDTTDATATPDDIVEGKTAYVNNNKITGTTYKHKTKDNFYAFNWMNNNTDMIDDGYGLKTNFKIKNAMSSTQNLYIDDTSNTGMKGTLSYDVITNAINLQAEDIKAGKTYLGVTGTLEELNGQAKEVTPTIETLTIVPDEGYNALTEVTVNPIQTETKTVKSNVNETQVIVPSENKFIKEITVEKINLQDKTVNPSREQQIISADVENDGLNEIIINPVENVRPEIIKEGESILDINGTVVELNGQAKEVTPTIETLTIVPDEGYNALTEVTVNAVTSDIDENIVAENIKKDVEILGVTGTLEELDTSDATATAEDIAKDKTAYVNGEKIIGTASSGSEKIMLPLNWFIKSSSIYGAIKDLTWLENTDGSNITSLSRFFYYCRYLENVKMFNTNHISSMNEMCYHCSSLISIIFNDTTNIENLYFAFADCSKLEEVIGLKITEKCTTLYYAFSGCSSLATLDVSNWNTSNVKTTSYTFSNCNKLNNINTQNLNLDKVTSTNFMFNNCNLLEEIDVSNFGMSNATEAAYMFQNCNLLTSLNVSNWNTGKLYNLSNMFNSCTNLVDIDISNWIKPGTNTVSAGDMFADCPSLSNDSLNGILKYLSKLTSISGGTTNKTLKYIGLSQEQAEICQTLSNWDMFSSSGWTTGY